MASPADIVIYGGAAGGGKTFALLMEAIRHINNKRFRCAIFRRTHTQVKQPGGLWDESGELYPKLGGVPNSSDLFWRFPSGMKVTFNYLQTATDMYQYQGAQIPLIMFDEVTHFSETQFFYMVSRLRSASGVKGYIRATCNPDPDSWVARFINWWIGEDGYPDSSRAGVIRWFVRRGDDIVWADSPKELTDQFGPKAKPKSVAFIPATLADNKILMEKDPEYESNLESLPLVEREQLLGGNWKIKPAQGMYFRGDQFMYCDRHELPKLRRMIRYWDRAATEPTSQNPDPDWTVGVLMGLCELGRPYVLDVERFRAGPAGVVRKIQATAAKDGTDVEIGIEQDPGQAGKSEAQSLISALSGYSCKAVRADRKKVIRAKPFSAQVQAGNVTMVRAHWNTDYTRELEAFDGSERGKDDQVDGSSGAFNMLHERKKKALIGRA